MPDSPSPQLHTPGKFNPAALEILRSRYGYKQFRFRQADIVQTLIAGNDALVLMPTGGGKSICYQIPALVRTGIGIVISPLIALMQDQVNALNTLGIRAAFLNSTQSYNQRHQVTEKVSRGHLDLLYVSPERLITDDFLQLLQASRIALFAIDEAHCVSQWGHDFRSDYLRLEVLPTLFPDIPRIALTATADRRTRHEIVERLQLKNAAVYVHSFDRPNIYYAISEGHNNRQRLWHFLQDNHAGDSGIVYCLSRKRVDQTAAWLNQKGRIALPYHAGMENSERAQYQHRFLSEEGVIIVATTAFGMGIDKPDVRFVAHLNLPRSLEAYYQETGRAGRDGLPANAWMAYGVQDVIQLRRVNQQSDADESHKILRQQKLDAMLGFCEQPGCRRIALLNYFDEQYQQACNHCDNCQQPPTTWNATEAARKALSCVYRTGQRFGISYLIQVLRGESDARIQRNGHDQQSTWGIGEDLSALEWRGIFRQLLAFAYLESDDALHGGFRLTRRAQPLLSGEESLELRTISTAPAHKRQRQETRPEQSGHPLFERLRHLRKTLAKEHAVPPYVIFHDKTLHELTSVQPRDLKTMATISGIGAKKLSSFGAAFLTEIADFIATQDSD